jgi:FkbM family methyltransferase
VLPSGSGRYDSAMLKVAIRRLVPVRLRADLFRMRRLGLAKHVAYRRLERRARRRQVPMAGAPFDIGAPRPIVLPASTVHTVRSHWVDYGHAIKELDAFRRLAPGHRVLFDVGAAEGIFSAAFCALTDGSAWAFEPSPTMFRRLSELRSVNPGFDIRLHHTALGATAGVVLAREYTDGQFSAAGVGEGATREMPVAALDEFVLAHGTAPDFMKIDVEGMELAVVIGGRETLSEHVRTVVLEVHYDALAQRGEAMEDLERALWGAGFRLRNLDLDEIPSLRAYAEREPEVIPGYTIVIARKER